ncbi:hypothetical protein QR680_010944 [Steinernema hermaphroditum]|uniref:Phospholipid-transporting ATPase n=1 Tax=Steinernema hermaphroditum TaxID=289476 RepID=A0AA39ITD4_9BILA|nr:hypothetical protein QR680_010944 [Steinernema hermaphroditum]
MQRQSRKRLQKKPLQIVVGHAKQKSCNRISTTKYNIVTFVPRFLLEQFQQYANIFFLCISAIQLAGFSPLGRYTTIGPLCVILAIAAATELFEDFRRRLSDLKMNRQPTYSYTIDQGWQKKYWANLKMGEIVKVNRDQTIPADLVLISASEPAGMAYIETASLDGESNLKIRQAVSATFKLTSEDDIKNFVDVGAQLTYEPPSAAIYDFAGVISINSPQQNGTIHRNNYPLGPGQMLPRGAKLKNTEWIYGIAVYTGKATKLMMNMTQTPTKLSGVDKITNHIMLVQFGLLGLISVIGAFSGAVWLNYRITDHWYLPFHTPSSYKQEERDSMIILILGQVTLYAGLIPISLYVYLVMVRLVQAFFIRCDMEMYREKSDTRAEVRRSNLNDELGQVSYVLADKTGTLTRNEMVFKMCSVAGKTYGKEMCEGFDGKELMEDLMTNRNGNAKNINEFFTIIATCHTVVPEKVPEKVIYHGSSPDETALVRCAQLLGYVFHTRTPESVIISSNGCPRTFEILNVLEFTSDRKRMGIIVKTPEDTIKLFLKGADTVILPRLSPSNSRTVVEQTKEHIRKFAVFGYRTLCIAEKELSLDEYRAWEPNYYKACCALEDRKVQIEKTAELIENNLTLVGATAIEDRLQEGVPETLKQFSEANIRVWVLTGDKLETATNIGMSCSLIRTGMNTLVISKDSRAETLETVKNYVHQQLPASGDDPNLVVVIDGRSLQHLVDEGAPFEFVRLALAASSLICCRCTPKQKAAMVHLLKKHIDGVVLAIGDGANDVAMIQAAGVGVGITGEEGMQAAMAADYSIGQFRYLARLLFVHGALSYYRTGKVVLFTFYKNLCQVFILFIFMLYSGMSDTPLMDPWSVMSYNLCQTSWSPLLHGMLDRHALTNTLAKHPSLYRLNVNKSRLNVKLHLAWSLNAVIHATIIFFLGIHFHSGDTLWSNGRPGAIYTMGCIVDFMLVFVINCKAVLETDAINPFTIYVFLGSIIFFASVVPLYGLAYPVFTSKVITEMAGIGSMLYTTPNFYLMIALGIVTSLLYDIVIKVIQRTLFWTIRERVLYLEGLKGDGFDALYHPLKKMINVFESDRNEQKKQGRRKQKAESGYAFAQDEGNIVNQSNLVRVYDSRKPIVPGSQVESETSVRIRHLSSLDKLSLRNSQTSVTDSNSEMKKKKSKKRDV